MFIRLTIPSTVPDIPETGKQGEPERAIYLAIDEVRCFREPTRDECAPHGTGCAVVLKFSSNNDSLLYVRETVEFVAARLGGRFLV